MVLVRRSSARVLFLHREHEAHHEDGEATHQPDDPAHQPGHRHPAPRPVRSPCASGPHGAEDDGKHARHEAEKPERHGAPGVEGESEPVGEKRDDPE
ncbi:hypothetical protein GA0115257_118729 [Streptomyces sp. LcepLS]|nr:hypothetical protein GA0115257_118729 [Streptomyces sp. LcepLS]